MITDCRISRQLVRFRPAEEPDIPAVCSWPQSEDELFFMYRSAKYPLTPEQLGESIARRSDSTVIEFEHVPAGFANFYRWEVGGICSIGNVIVAPQARGRGVGRLLIEEMVRMAFSMHQASEVTISRFNQNTTGLLLYSKLGFRPYDIEERRDSNQNRAALIHLRLSRGAH